MRDVDPDLELRLAVQEDAALMHDIIQTAFLARPALNPPADALGETVDDVRRHLAGCTGIIASREGTDIGCLFVCLHPDERQASLHRVSVLPGRLHTMPRWRPARLRRCSLRSHRVQARRRSYPQRPRIIVRR